MVGYQNLSLINWNIKRGKPITRLIYFIRIIDRVNGEWGGGGAKWGNVLWMTSVISVKCDKIKVRHIVLTKHVAILG